MGNKSKVTVALILDLLVRILEFFRSRLNSSTDSVNGGGMEYRQDTNENTDAKSKLTDYLKKHTKENGK